MKKLITCVMLFTVTFYSAMPLGLAVTIAPWGPMPGNGDNAVTNWNPWIGAMGGEYDKTLHRQWKYEGFQNRHAHSVSCSGTCGGIGPNGQPWLYFNDGGGSTTLIGLR